MDAASDDELTCGKGVAASADLPEKLSAVMKATADMLESHVRALDAADARGLMEIDAYRMLIAEQRAIGGRLDALVSMMRGCHDLPMADHDMDVVMDRASADAFVALVDSESDLLELLQDRARDYAEMLAAEPDGAAS
jgi:hypothetical protein